MLLAAVRHREPDGTKKLVLGFIATDSGVFFCSIIPTALTFNVRTPWQYCRICSLDLPMNIIHTYQVSYEHPP